MTSITAPGTDNEIYPYSATAMRPIHPGEILRLEFMDPMELTAGKIARACGVPRTRIERIAREDYPITADTALRLGRFFGTTPQFWLNLQINYDLASAIRTADGLDTIKPFHAEAR